ncbi:MAG: hypothetical protein WBA57_13900 [Elainellaceae cyanobacterium]
MTDQRLNQHASDQKIDSSASARPYVLIGGVMGGLVGIGVLLFILMQNLEIVVEPGIAPTESPTLSESTESLGDNEPANAGNQNAASEEGISAEPGAEDGSGVDSSDNAPIQIAPGDRVGGLRVSNQTTHPLRVALLPQASGKAEDEGQVSTYSEPVHWDFVPGEGAAGGLVLAVPDNTLTLQPGDVLTAFAQDGSQRYWGPFVVGATSFPQWDDQSGEWSLILRDDS